MCLVIAHIQPGELYSLKVILILNMHIYMHIAPVSHALLHIDTGT